jgi:hypothetical protein
LGGAEVVVVLGYRNRNRERANVLNRCATVPAPLRVRTWLRSIEFRHN